MLKYLILPVVFALLTGLSAQQSSCPCCTAEYRAFDFWLGEWDVIVGGQKVGTNTIESAQDSCLLIENWRGSSGTNGNSMNYYDRKDGSWNQLWVSNTGYTLRLKGNFSGKEMILVSEPEINESGQLLIQKITWTPNDDGSVRQLWESSTDGGKKWNTAFDGLYIRK